MPQDRIARAPVPVWAGRLRDRLTAARGGQRGRWAFAETVGTISNQAALIAAFQGDVDTAATLCRSQMVWQNRMSRRTGDPELALLGVQPWVNLGRLEAQTGEWEAALERFARLVHPGAGGRLCLGSARIGTRGRATARQGGFGGFLRNVYVVDSLKALLANRRWDETLAFTDRVGSDSPNGSRADEARVVAYCRMGDPQRGAEIAGTGRRRSSGWTRAVFALRLAEALGLAGRVDEAVIEMARLAGTLRALSPGAQARLDNLYVIVRVAQACWELGLVEDARALAQGAAQAAQVAEDEVLGIEALRVLRAGGDALATEALDALEGGTGYARFRRGARPPLRDAAAEMLYEELRKTLA